MSSVNAMHRQAHESAPVACAAHWSLHAGFVLSLAVFFWFFFATFQSLVHIWSNSGLFQYAFLIIPVSMFLVWLQRDKLRITAKKPAATGLFLMAGCGLLWLLGAVAEINLARHFSFIAMLPSLVLAFYGWRVLRVLLFPLAYLFFAVPVGGFLVGPLQDITARLSVFALHFTNVAVFVDGRYIYTPASTWHVAEACSGIKFFFATMAFGALYAWLFYQRLHRRLIFIGFVLVVPIIANGLRVFFTILIGEYFGLQYATGTDHLIFGWQFFGLVLLLLFLAGWPWHEPDSVMNAPRMTIGRVQRGTGSVHIPLLVVCSLVLLVVPPVWSKMITIEPGVDAPPRELALPDQLAGMAQLRPLDVGAGPGTMFRKANIHARARYGTAQLPVLVNMAVYLRAHEQSSELITHGNQVYEPADWQATPIADDNMAPPDFAALQLTSRVNANERWLLWYVYRSGGHATTSKIMVKLWQIPYRLLGQTAAAEVLTLAAPITGDDTAGAAARLDQVAQELLPWLQRHVPGES